MKNIFDKKIDVVVLHKNPLTNACCSLCKLAALSPSKFLSSDSFKLFGFYSTHPGGYVTLKVVALHGCGFY